LLQHSASDSEVMDPGQLPKNIYECVLASVWACFFISYTTSV
jgi:hypothetical protein